MRAIKFRMWNEITKMMLDLKKMTPLALNMDTDGLFIPFCGMPLMQFTGLHDKNSREIYEGDIVKSQDCLYEDVGRWKIVWAEEEGGYWLADDMLHCALAVSEVQSLHLEVIGNIYENPELIEREGRG